MMISLKQRKIKFEPRTKLNNNIYEQLKSAKSDNRKN